MDRLAGILLCLLSILMFAGFWKMLVKASLPGWGILVPLYGHYLILKVVGRPWWWLFPVLNLIFIIVPFEIAGKFGKGFLFGLGLLVLPFIFYPILGFGDAQYTPSAA